MEKDFQHNLHKHLDTQYPALSYFHSGDPRRDTQPGFPDLVIVGRHVLWRELKMPYKRLTAAQVIWKYRLLAAGADWGIWYPDDLESGTIDEQLLKIA